MRINPESHFPSVLSLPFANVNSDVQPSHPLFGYKNTPLRPNSFFLAGVLLMGSQEEGLPSWPFRHAVLPARTRCLPSPWLLCPLLAASPRCLSHPGHKLFIRATEHHHKPHSFNRTSHASACKCCDDLGRGDTARTLSVEGTRDWQPPPPPPSII